MSREMVSSSSPRGRLARESSSIWTPTFTKPRIPYSFTDSSMINTWKSTWHAEEARNGHTSLQKIQDCSRVGKLSSFINKFLSTEKQTTALSGPVSENYQSRDILKGKFRWPDSNSMFRGPSCNRTTSKEWPFPRHWRGHDKQWTACQIRKFNRRNEGYLQHDNEIKNTPSISQRWKNLFRIHLIDIHGVAFSP
jgi:hypothetical protein